MGVHNGNNNKSLHYVYINNIIQNNAELISGYLLLMQPRMADIGFGENAFENFMKKAYFVCKNNN